MCEAKTNHREGKETREKRGGCRRKKEGGNVRRVLYIFIDADFF
jgi:hypothetical protein